MSALLLVCACSTLMSAHSTSVVRHDVVGQETLLNLLLRNYLHYNLYDQVTQQNTPPTGQRREAVCVVDEDQGWLIRSCATISSGDARGSRKCNQCCACRQAV